MNGTFLNLVQNRNRGKLKIYIGMAPGVGKTYRMLQEAHALLSQGVDVCLGFIETHQRVETHALLDGLPMIPMRTFYYRGREQAELDLRAVLNRRPEVAIVDELAHTNATCSTNAKRWQDVEQMLDAGISVITAVNIQHIESLSADITRITSVEVAERVPDGFVNLADEVVNIDLTASDLVARLKQGKIYKPEKIEQALGNFFQEEALLQLRELALREVARQVDRQIDTRLPQSSEAFQAARIALCISTNHINARKMIRKMARFITGDHAEWWVLYVQTPNERADQVVLSKQRHLINNLKLATEMGAKVETIKADTFATAVFDFVKAHKITLLGLGKTQRPWWKQVISKGPTEQLLELAHNYPVDFLIIAADES